ncbi:MAG: hypothetical protein JO159_19315 [Acidobacteria bacterium]|nr:hypothetical protein [Acidobacteriota bacterium]
MTSLAQTAPRERSFAVSTSTVRDTLKKLPGGTSGPLPALEGFTLADTRSLESYQLPYYQCTVRITPASTGESLVRVTAKITAWNRDPAHARYEVLESNGRIESDLLNRLQAALSSLPNPPRQPDINKSSHPATQAEPPPEISAPMPQLPVSHGLKLPVGEKPAADPVLEHEARGLEEILRHQSHPTNLAAVKQDRTPMLQSPRTDSMVLFLASAEDEFEILNITPDWVYVRISGLSRGWLRRSSVQLVDGSTEAVSGVQRKENGSETPAPFVVSSDVLGSFPGEWTPLKGKLVRIISIQQTPNTGRITSPQDKLHFAESEFKRETAPLAPSAGGVVLVFDSEDGGMVAATAASLEHWKNGGISDAVFWKQCYFDPPEILGRSTP